MAPLREEFDWRWRVSSSWQWLLIATTLTAIAIRIARSKSTRPRLPPGPPKWPVVGCLPHLSFRGCPPEVMFAELAERYGEIMLLWMGMRPYVVVSSARMAREFLKTHDAQFANRPTSVVRDYVGFKGNSIISMAAGDPLYQRLRRVFVVELLSPKKVAGSRELRKEQMLKMLQATRDELGASHRVDFKKPVSTLALNLSMCMIFGRRCGGEVVPEEIETLLLTFKKTVKLIKRINISDLLPSIRWLDIQGIEAELRDVEIQLRKSIMVLIEQKRLEMSSWSAPETESDADERDIMSKLLSLEGEDRLNDDQQMGVVFALLVAGTDSVSLGIGQAMEQLLKHPHLHTRALEELDTVVGTMRLVEEADIPNLPFLQTIVKETLRLHPPAQMLIPHGNTDPCEVAGFHIPARSSVLVNLYALSRDGVFWDEPLAFDPDRFRGEGKEGLSVVGSDFHYIPFGSGKRGCPGVGLGMITVQYGLALCLQCVHWRLSPLKNGTGVGEEEVPGLFVDGELRVDARLLHTL